MGAREWLPLASAVAEYEEGTRDCWRSWTYASRSVFGWVYFLLWSLSFYPQPLLNWRRKSTAGLTVAYPLLNVLGFACYASATGALLFNPTVRHQYAIRFPTAPEPVVEPNDFAFALHGLVLCAITYSQLWPRLWGFEAVPGQQASRLVLGVFFGCINGLFSVSVAVVTDPDTPDAWTSLDIVNAAFQVKIIVTCIKYVPQAMNNFKTKSTEGWAIEQVLLDFTGGILSLAQLLIDCSLQADWSGVTGNWAKLGLSLISILFDVLFIIQHYVLYPHAKVDDGERTALLAE